MYFLKQIDNRIIVLKMIAMQQNNCVLKTVKNLKVFKYLDINVLWQRFSLIEINALILNHYM